MQSGALADDPVGDAALLGADCVYAFEAPLAPLVAARAEGRTIELEPILERARRARARARDPSGRGRGRAARTALRRSRRGRPGGGARAAAPHRRASRPGHGQSHAAHDRGGAGARARGRRRRPERRRRREHGRQPGADRSASDASARAGADSPASPIPPMRQAISMSSWDSWLEPSASGARRVARAHAARDRAAGRADRLPRRSAPGQPLLEQLPRAGRASAPDRGRRAGSRPRRRLGLLAPGGGKRPRDRRAGGEDRGLQGLAGGASRRQRLSGQRRRAGGARRPRDGRLLRPLSTTPASSTGSGSRAPGPAATATATSITWKRLLEDVERRAQADRHRHGLLDGRRRGAARASWSSSSSVTAPCS